MLYGTLILMNLITSLMVTQMDEKKAETSLIKQRIEAQIKVRTGIIPR